MLGYLLFKKFEIYTYTRRIIRMKQMHKKFNRNKHIVPNSIVNIAVDDSFVSST